MCSECSGRKDVFERARQWRPSESVVARDARRAISLQPLSLAACAPARTLLTPDSEHMIPLASASPMASLKSPPPPAPLERSPTRARCRIHFAAKPPHNGGESAAAADFELERFLHLYALNRGVLLTPFTTCPHVPATTESDIDAHTKNLRLRRNRTHFRVGQTLCLLFLSPLCLPRFISITTCVECRSAATNRGSISILLSPQNRGRLSIPSPHLQGDKETTWTGVHNPLPCVTSRDDTGTRLIIYETATTNPPSHRTVI